MSNKVPAFHTEMLQHLNLKCWCYNCYMEQSGDLFRQIMHLCPDCGNKRCPRATDHNLECTGSNKPNQKGSIYE